MNLDALLYKSRMHLLVLGAVLLALFQTLNLSPNAVYSIDSDSTFRLLQAERFLTGQNAWNDTLIPGLQPPLGAKMIWTRPVDMMLGVFYYPARLFMDSKPAILLAGYLLPLVLAAALLLLVGWGTAPFCPNAVSWAVALAITLIAGITPFSTPFWADHHLPMAVVLAGIILCSLRVWVSSNPRYPLYAGLLAGIGLWISPEMLIGVLFGAQILLLRQLSGAPSNSISRFFAATLCVIVPAIFLENADWQTAQYDRISIVQITVLLVFLLIAALWERLSNKTLLTRLAAGAVLSAGGLVLLQSLFPPLFMGPFAAMSPWLLENFVPLTEEMLPLFSLKPALIAQYAFVPALGCAACFIYAARHRSGLWLSVALLPLTLLLLMCLYNRWVFHMPAVAGLCSIPLTLFLQAALKRAKLILPPILVFSLLGFSGVWGVMGAKVLFPEPPTTASTAPKTTQSVGVNFADFMHTYKPSDARGVIAAHQNYGGQLLLHTGLLPLSANYHTAEPGMRAERLIRETADTAVFWDTLRQWKVAYVFYARGDAQEGSVAFRLLFAGNDAALRFVRVSGEDETLREVGK